MVDQSILGRFLDYGTVVVRGTGIGMEPLRNISYPLEFRNMIDSVTSPTSLPPPNGEVQFRQDPRLV